MILGEGLDLEAIRADMLRRGDSVLVVGDDRTARIHVHTDDPGGALTYAGSLGQLAKIKIDNMALQRDQLFAAARAGSGTGASSAPTGDGPPHVPAAPVGRAAIVAVAAGSGLRRLFASLGATAVVPGGQTMNPSIQELLEAVEAVPADEAILLPNNKNIVMTARQVAGLTSKRLAVVPTQTIPQGIAAMFAYNFEADLDANAEAMAQAARATRTVEVTRAVRAVTLNGVDVEAGAAIALIDGELALAGADLEEVALAALARLDPASRELITMYAGADAGVEAAHRLADQLVDQWPSLAVEVVDGGQPHYQYILQVE